jgi:hypothetical protein
MTKFRCNREGLSTTQSSDASRFRFQCQLSLAEAESGMDFVFENISRFTNEVPVFTRDLRRGIHRNLSRKLHRHDY